MSENPDLEKILQKSFADLTKRLNTLMTRNEKKIARDLKTTKNNSRPKKEKDRETKRSVSTESSD
jgi:hypothetical protein